MNSGRLYINKQISQNKTEGGGFIFVVPQTLTKHITTQK